MCGGAGGQRGHVRALPSWVGAGRVVRLDHVCQLLVGRGGHALRLDALPGVRTRSAGEPRA